jgi:hypothetical protein
MNKKMYSKDTSELKMMQLQFHAITWSSIEGNKNGLAMSICDSTDGNIQYDQQETYSDIDKEQERPHKCAKLTAHGHISCVTL